MDIVLNTAFNNPNLPVIDRAGFFDDFERPAAASLGETSREGRQWTAFYPSGSLPVVWGTIGDGTAGCLESGGLHQMAVADAQATNGTLSAKFSGDDSDHRRFGLSARVVDAQNWLAVAASSSSADDVRIIQRIDGNQRTLSQGFGPVLEDGDVLSIALNGTAVTLLANGEEILTATCDASLVGVTTHGLYAFSGGLSWWDWIEFTT